ncbi:hypothetical protein ACIQ9E_17615 [Streptomyces sp. NPDC094448]|uniref:hypothetical protein n=1 Tax=Streptomyces sp. NPDC094448 TaxID=3366063 RepID=UPI003815E3D5
MTIRTVWHAPTGQTPEDTRLATSALLTPVGALTSRGGVLPGGLELKGLGAFQCQIMPGRAVVQTGDRQGAYLVVVTEDETVTLAPSSPDGSRKDRIVLAIEDNPYDASGAARAVIKVIQGVTAVTGPQEPAAPPNTLPLFTVTVARNAGHIDWATAVENRRYPTAALGGIVPTGGFNGWYKGQYRDSGDRLERWTGGPNGVWETYPRPQAWRPWTPTWTVASGTNPVPGNWTHDCWYVQHGLTVHFTFRVVFGSTTNFQSSTTNWRFGLPVASTARHTHGIGFAELHHVAVPTPLPAKPSDRGVGRMRITGANWFEIELSSGLARGAAPGIGIIDAAFPWAWTNGDHIVGSGTYEAATSA